LDLPFSDLAGARKCRETRKRRAASAVTFTDVTLPAEARRSNGRR
jgi:hypothetical protein